MSSNSSLNACLFVSAYVCASNTLVRLKICTFLCNKCYHVDGVRVHQCTSASAVIDVICVFRFFFVHVRQCTSASIVIDVICVFHFLSH